MWKIYYKDRTGGQNPDFWGEKLLDLDVARSKEMGKQDYMTDIFLKYFPKKGKILDGGCGIGQHVLAYKDLGYQIEGLDFSEEAISKIIKFDKNAPCKKGNILKIDVPDSSFDCYYSFGVLEHFEEGPFEALDEARRILKDDGIFMMTVPYENLFRRIKFNILNLIAKLGGKSHFFTNIGFIKKVNGYFQLSGKNSNIRFHEHICNKKEILSALILKGFKVEYMSPC
ncbi:MAG: class I SAM-dependent methyltransferase, partial [Candidatus Firestonebacteria bacterium]